MIDTTKLIKKLSGTPKYGSRILCKPSEPQKAHTISKIQIYVDNCKYFFRHPEDNDVYICIGEVGICDEITLKENFAKIISALELKTENGKLVSYNDEEEKPWWYN
jgi:hypothetical protein